EGIAQRQRDGRARGRGECFRTGFLGDRGVEHDRRLPSQRRVRIARQRDDRYAEPLQLIDETEQLVRRAALREDDADVVSAHDAEVTSMRVQWMEDLGRS